MSELKNVSSLVRMILEEDEKARNSDNYLYFKVLQHYGNQTGIDINAMSVPTFLLQMKGSFPPFETVRRTRQKVQQVFPSLSACEKVEEGRIIQEEKYRAYAQSLTV